MKLKSLVIFGGIFIAAICFETNHYNKNICVSASEVSNENVKVSVSDTEVENMLVSVYGKEWFEKFKKSENYKCFLEFHAKFAQNYGLEIYKDYLIKEHKEKTENIDKKKESTNTNSNESEAIPEMKLRIAYGLVDEQLDCYEIVDGNDNVIMSKSFTCDIYGWKNRKEGELTEGDKIYEKFKKLIEEFENSKFI